MTADRRNLVITGYMGTGKSSVARGVARQLGHRFVDMDEVIEKRAGMSIADIFAQQGEDTFRGMERALCEELVSERGLVIATGGGALVDGGNRATMVRTGCLVCLDCQSSELVYRLRGDRGRPMLWSDDPATKLKELYEQRLPAYAQIPYHIDTTHRSVEQVIDEVAQLYGAIPRHWHVSTPTGKYYVYLHPGGLRHLGSLIRVRGIQGKVVVVADENVWPLHGARALDGLRSAGYTASEIVLPAGEEHKSLVTMRTIYDRFVRADLDRSGAVVALGGGVITDMAGFAAATFMRGVALVQAPTSLLGMVDASVGGKVAVDLPQGKNLVGAFVRPLFVMLDTDTLATLPDIERRAGMAEVIKAGIIADQDLFRRLEDKGPGEDLRWLVERALQVKIDVVEEDPYEHGRRAVLNLGHTFAHAFEVLSDYGLHHGQAVSLGMAAAAHLGEIRGLCSEATRERVIATLDRHGLPIQYTQHPPLDVYRAMRMDKKRRGSNLRFILPKAIGEVIIDGRVPEGEVISALERIRA